MRTRLIESKLYYSFSLSISSKGHNLRQYPGYLTL